MRRLTLYLNSLSSREKALAVMGLVGYVVLFLRYKDNLGDFGDFIRAGNLIWDQQNPYFELMYVNSPVSAVLFYLLSKPIPLLLIPFFIQTLNIVGLLFFFRLILGNTSREILFWIFFMLLFFNSTRALIANVQVTGILLGLIAFSFNLAIKHKPAYMVVFPLWLAMELKPQLAIAFVLIILFSGKVHKLRIAILTFYYLSSHFLVSLKFGSSIDLLWVEKIVKYSSNSLREGYEISYWKAIAIFLNEENLIGILVRIVVLLSLLLIIYLSIKSKLNWAILIAITFPIQNSYLHLYDLVPVSILLIVAYSRDKSPSAIFGLLFFVQLYPLDLFTQLPLLVLLSIYLFLYRETFTGLRLASYFLIALFYVFSSASILMGQSEEMQMILTLTIPILYVLYLNRRHITSLINFGTPTS